MSEFLQDAEGSVVVSMEAVTNTNTATNTNESNNQKSNPMHRRRPSDSTLVSLSSDSTSSCMSDCSLSVTSPSDTSVNGDESNRRKRNRGRKTQKKRIKKEPEDLVAKAVAQMNLSMQEQNQYLALDCEMVGVGYKGKHSALARVTIVDWNHNVVLDEYVKPGRPITDYRSYVSGITPEILEQATNILDLESCRQKVLQFLQGKILVGHGLKNDLRALGIHLPWYSVRDTAKYEPFMKARFDDGILWPQSLKVLAKNRLRRDIQIPGQAHSPVEDAATAMDLYKVARKKWEMAMDYKLSKTREIEQQQQ